MASKKLRTFQLESVLKDSPLDNRISLLGRFGDQPGQAIVVLSRQHFAKDTTEALLQELSSIDINFENDIYGKYVACAPPAYSPVVIDTIYPATDLHIKKHSDQKRFLVTETPSLYKKTVLPYIDSIPPSRIQWVYNILGKQAEADRLIYEDADPQKGFMIHPDLKWDQSQLQNLYCVVLCHRRDIRSLRDLGPEHLPLLKNIRDTATEEVSRRFNVPVNHLHLYVHYQPSYYHFHVHLSHVEWVGPGTMVGKAHLLQDIIGNIEGFAPDYYQRCSLTYTLGETDPLWSAISAASA